MFSCFEGKLLPSATVALSCLAFASHASAQTCDKAALELTVVDAVTHVPSPNASVVASWHDGSEHSVKERTDSLGIARFCAPVRQVVSVRASLRNLNSQTISVLLDTLRINHRRIEIDMPYGLVRGSVVDAQTGQPIPNVAVSLARTPLNVISGDDGKFYFTRVPVGEYTVRADHISYGPYHATFKMEGEDLDATIPLTPAAIPIAPLKVVAFSQRLERAGFYDRQKRGIGTFMNRKQIEAMNAQMGSDVLRQVPSLREQYQVTRGRRPRYYTPGRGNCRFQFIVDGTRTLPDFEMDNIAPGVMEGVEVYNGLAEVPAAFRSIVNGGGGTCGVIAVWTRDGR